MASATVAETASATAAKTAPAMLGSLTGATRARRQVQTRQQYVPEQRPARARWAVLGCEGRVAGWGGASRLEIPSDVGVGDGGGQWTTARPCCAQGRAEGGPAEHEGHACADGECAAAAAAAGESGGLWREKGVSMAAVLRPATAADELVVRPGANGPGVAAGGANVCEGVRSLDAAGRKGVGRKGAVIRGVVGVGVDRVGLAGAADLPPGVGADAADGQYR